MPHRAGVGRSASRRTSAFRRDYEYCRTLQKGANVCGSGPAWSIDSLTSPPVRGPRRVTRDSAKISLISGALLPFKTLKPFIGKLPPVSEPPRDEFNLFGALGPWPACSSVIRLGTSGGGEPPVGLSWPPRRRAGRGRKGSPPSSG